MALIYNRNFYTNPKTPAHWRSTLDQIRRIDEGVAEQIEEIFISIALLEGWVGPVTAMYDATAAIGAALYSTGDGTVGLADNDASAATTRVVGLSTTATTTGQEGAYLTAGHLQQADWTAITGSTSLTPNAIYYLGATPGTLTATAPTSGGFIVPVAVALTADTLDIRIQPSVQL